VILALGLTACGRAPQEGPSVLRPVPDDPTVTFMVQFRAGSQNDPPGKEGLAYLTGLMLSEAATEKNAYQEILRKLYPLASSYAIRVDKETATLSGRTHRDNLETYLELFTDAYVHPKFDPADFERHRSNVLNDLEKTLRYASDEELGKAALHAFVFERTPYRHPPQGTVEGVEAITLDDVKAFYTRHYTRDTALPALGGGYPEELVGRLQSTLEELPQGRPDPVPPPRPEPFEGVQVLLVSKPGADASISFGFPIRVKRGEREFYALWLANSWLGEHRNSSSHLYQVIRETRGMNYGNYSYIEWFPEGGMRQMPPPNVGRRQQLFEVWIRTLPNDKAHFALRAAMRELHRLVEEGLSEDEFLLTRSFLQKYVLHFAATNAVRLGYAVDDRFYGIPAPGHLARFREILPTLTRDEVNAAIRKHFQVGNVKVAMVTGDAEGLRDALVADAPSPVIYTSPKPQEVLDEDREIEVFPIPVKPESVRIVPVEQFLQR
jgi:zinc protease